MHFLADFDFCPDCAGHLECAGWVKLYVQAGLKVVDWFPLRAVYHPPGVADAPFVVPCKLGDLGACMVHVLVSSVAHATLDQVDTLE